MPAPTALQQQSLEAAPLSDVPLNDVDQDLGDDFTLEGINEMPESADIIAPASAAAEEGMEIDEEGKPRFAPVQNIVCAALLLPSTACALQRHRGITLKMNVLRLSSVFRVSHS